MLKGLRLVYGFTILILATLVPLSAQAASGLSSTFTTNAAGADVTIANNGTHPLYNVSLQVMGPGTDAVNGPVSVGTIPAGGKIAFRIDGISPVGYMVLNGSGSDVAGQAVAISVVSEGK